MKKNYFKYLSYLFYTLTFLSGFTFLFFTLQFYKFILPHFHLDKVAVVSIIMALFTCLFSYLGSLSLYQYHKDKKIMKTNLKIMFITYILLTFYLMVLARGGLGITTIFSHLNNFDLTEYSFIPFASTIEMLKDVFHSLDYNRLYLLLGNLLCLMPLAYFLPRLFPKKKKFLNFTITIFLISFSIELFQFILMRGLVDIDDIIYNTLGALIVFYPFNYSFISKILDKIFLLTNDKLTNKDIIKGSILLILITISFFLAGYYYYYKPAGWEFKILDESTTCEEEKELIYEDDYFEYYLHCKKSDKLYIVFDNKYKYLLVDVLNKKITNKYTVNFSIDSISDWYIKESKGYDITVEYELKDNEDLYIDDSKTKNDIINLESNGFNSSQNKISTEYFITPLKEGKATITFYIRGLKDDSLVDEITYEFKVNKNLKVTYELIK